MQICDFFHRIGTKNVIPGLDLIKLTECNKLQVYLVDTKQLHRL